MPFSWKRVFHTLSQKHRVYVHIIGYRTHICESSNLKTQVIFTPFKLKVPGRQRPFVHIVHVSECILNHCILSMCRQELTLQEICSF